MTTMSHQFQLAIRPAGMPDLLRKMTQWINEGKVTWQETVHEGLESAPDAFIELFSGGNTGKMLVRLPDA